MRILLLHTTVVAVLAAAKATTKAKRAAEAIPVGFIEQDIIAKRKAKKAKKAA